MNSHSLGTDDCRQCMKVLRRSSISATQLAAHVRFCIRAGTYTSLSLAFPSQVKIFAFCVCISQRKFKIIHVIYMHRCSSLLQNAIPYFCRVVHIFGTKTNRTPNAESGDDDGEVSSSSYCVRARGDVIYYVQYIQMWSDDDDELEWESRENEDEEDEKMTWHRQRYDKQ